MLLPNIFPPQKMCSKKVTSRDGKTRVKYARTLEMINPHAAGLDLHKEKIWACASTSDHSDSQIQAFGTCTEDVRKLGQWLKKSKINSVAMESTGVYWVPVYNILSSYGIKPVLVNAREIKDGV